MKKLITMAVLALMASPVSATVFNDTVGDLFAGAPGGGILDIVSVEVTNDASNINFKFTLGADVTLADWGKYMVIIDSAPGGDTVSNGWVRPISMTTGAESWLGSWVDFGGGVQTWNFGAAWVQDATTTLPVISGNMTTISASLAVLGLSPGDTIQFDAFSSGGGGTDGAVDSLGDPNVHITDWGIPSNAVPVSYTLVPEPASLVLFGFGALALIRRRR